MEPLSYVKAATPEQAITDGGKDRTAFLAGGTLLVDLMRLAVMRPAALVDITGLDAKIADLPDGGLRIGALATNTDVAHHASVQKRYPVLAEAILAGASPQIRNLATTGGNLLQRTRCPYFRDPGVAACNKRAPGSGCAAIGGFTRSHAILGTSDKCIATHPSDQNVALVALGAKVLVKGPKAERAIPIEELYTLPGDHPEIEHTLVAGELIVGVELPAASAKSHYVKVRDRASYAFALASAAIVLDGERTRVAFGGIGTVPWRSREAEAVLAKGKAGLATYQAAADAALAGAKAQDGNRFKIELAKRTLVRALIELGGAA